MKLLKRLLKLVKNCILILGAIVIGTHMIHSISLSNEARQRIVYATAAYDNESSIRKISATDLKDMVKRQKESNIEAQERYLANRTEVIKHKANQIELKKEELERMEAQGYKITGDTAVDTLTMARYTLRKECIKYNLDISKFASEEEIMKMADIYVKKAENIKLTDEEMQFYAVMKGKTKKLNKVIENQEQKEIAEQVAQQKSYEKQQKRSDGVRHLLRNYGAQGKANYTETMKDGVTKTIRGNKIIYTFESQERFIENQSDYLTKIASNPYSYVVAIENQRIKPSTYNRLDPILIEKINNHAIYIDDTILNQNNIEIYFTSNEAGRNKITKALLPVTETGEIDDTDEAVYSFKAQTKRSDKIAEEGGLLKKYVLDYFKPKEQKEYEARLKALK